MILLRNILHPTDFSGPSRHAGHYAQAFCERFDAELHVLHVQPHPAAAPAISGGLLPLEPPPDTTRQGLEPTLEERLGAEVSAEWAAQRRVWCSVREGPAFLRIIEYAREFDIDLIVMGTHGRSGLTQMLLGSVAEKVVRKAPCPVLTVRPEDHQFVMP